MLREVHLTGFGSASVQSGLWWGYYLEWAVSTPAAAQPSTQCICGKWDFFV